MKLNVLYFLSFYFFFILRCEGQTTLDINFFFSKIEKSNSSTIVDNEYIQRKIQNKLFYKELLPKISLNLSIPYQRSISEVIQPDGSTKYFERNFFNSNSGLNISQVLPFTGGTLSLSNSINYSRDFNNNVNNFSSNWVSLSYQQSINGFNSYKWNKEIKKIEYRIDSLNYLKEKTKLKTEIAKIYSEATIAQFKIILTNKNIEKTNALLKEFEQKYLYGRIISSEVEQIKIALEQLKGLQITNNIEYQSLIEHLLDEVQIEDKDTLNLKMLDEVDFDIDKSSLLIAMENNGDLLKETLSLLKADANIEQISKEGSAVLNLRLGMGVNSSAQDFDKLYNNPSQSQFVTLSASIPILDWKANKDKRKIAELQKENLKLKAIEEKHHKIQQIDDIIKYHYAFKHQLNSIKKQIILSDKILEDTKELLTLGRKTISDYKILLYENFNLIIEKQKIINNLNILKLQLDEINLTNLKF